MILRTVNIKQCMNGFIITAYEHIMDNDGKVTPMRADEYVEKSGSDAARLADHLLTPGIPNPVTANSFMAARPVDNDLCRVPEKPVAETQVIYSPDNDLRDKYTGLSGNALSK